MKAILIVGHEWTSNVETRADMFSVKYVALLALQKIVQPHPYLVSLHQDVILGCLDDLDISIRLRALDLLVNMVDSSNLMSIVGKLMRQLHNSPIASDADASVHDRTSQGGIVPTADSDEEDPEESLKPSEQRSDQPLPLPEEYRIAVAKRILEMSSRDTYVNVTDFLWYIDVLVQLVSLAPVSTASTTAGSSLAGASQGAGGEPDVTRDIGLEILNIAVRVRDVRLEATRAAERLILESRSTLLSSSGASSKGFLRSAAWIVGEYAEFLAHPGDTLSAVLHPSSAMLPTETLAIYLQAIPKIFIVTASVSNGVMSRESRTMTSLRTQSIVRFLEPLNSHPSLEVQERSVEMIELMRLIADAISTQPSDGEDINQLPAPLVMTQVVPSLFTGFELNPVAPGAQKKVPLPDGLDLDVPINEDLPSLLQAAVLPPADDADFDESTLFYHRRPKPTGTLALEPAAKMLDQANTEAPSYQNQVSYDDSVVAMKRRAERRERNKDDPFYIPTKDGSEAASPIHNIIRHSNGDEVDIDSIPVMDLDIDSGTRGSSSQPALPATDHPLPRKRVDITVDETISIDSDNKKGATTGSASRGED